MYLDIPAMLPIHRVSNDDSQEMGSKPAAREQVYPCAVTSVRNDTVKNVGEKKYTVLTKQLSLSKMAPRYPARFNAAKSIWRMSFYVDTVKNEQENLWRYIPLITTLGITSRGRKRS